MSETGERLVATIGRTFNKRMKTDREFLRLAGKIPKSADYVTAGDYAVRTGELLSESIVEHVRDLPNMPRELAEEILPPVLEYDYSLTAEAVKTVQNNMNAEAGLGIGAVVAPLNVDRITGLVTAVSKYPTMDEALWILQEPIVNFTQSVVDDSLKKNAEESAKMGIRRYVVRKAESYEKKARKKEPGRKRPHYYVVPCEWCAKLAKRYEYKGNGQNVPPDVFRRHEGCRCTLTFENGKERQNVWDHAQKWSADDADGQRKAVEQVKAQREAEIKRKAEDAKTRAAEVEFIMERTGRNAKQAAIWRNMRLAQIREVGGIENYFAQGGM